LGQTGRLTADSEACFVYSGNKKVREELSNETVITQTTAVYIHPVINVSDSLLSQQSEHK
jgi:hypothetical protein